VGKWQEVLDGAMGASMGVDGAQALAKLVWESEGTMAGLTVAVDTAMEQDGIAVAVRFSGRVPKEVHCAVTLTTPKGGPVLVRPPASAFGDADRRLFLLVACGDMARKAHVYLPYCALDYDAARRARLQVTLVGGRRKVLARESVDVSLPAAKLFSRARTGRPLVGLCMSVGCADGKLGTAEMHMILDVLSGADLDTGQKGALREVMKSEPAGSVEDLAALTLRRFPNVGNHGLWLELMGQVAHGDGVLDEAEVEVIRRAAMAFGLREDVWARQRERLKLKADGAKLWEHYVTLGLTTGTSFDDVKRAYRERVSAAAKAKVDPSS